MFLNLLNEKEKELFLSLAVKAAESNGCVEAEELMLINDYSREMNIESNSYEDIKSRYALETLFQEVSKSLISHKRIIMFELIGLMHADNYYDEMEIKFINDLAEKIGMNKKEVEVITRYAAGYISNVREISEFFISEG